MPLGIKWSVYHKEYVSKLDDFLGIYELGNNNAILYIGEGKVRTRLLSHFPQGGDPMVGISQFRVDYTGSKETAGQRERAEIKKYRMAHNGKLPRFNQKSG